MIKQGIESEKWPHTKGVIISNEIEVKPGDKKNSTPHYLVHLKYDYQLKDTRYTGTTITFKGMDGSKEGAQELSNQYPVGRTVSVYYNPSNNKDTTLEVGLDKFLYGFIIAPLLVWCVATILVIFAWDNKK